MDLPKAAVVVSTRNRGESIIRTGLSILKNDYPHFELIVVDQSDNDLTQNAIRPFLKDSRFRYIRSQTRGLSAGRNIGIESAQSEFIALTDDDCETPDHWLGGLVKAFSLDHRIGVIFGNVETGPHDSNQGSIPAYLRKGSFIARSVYEMHRVNGISACMGLRRSVWFELGGFDELLGAGGRFRSAEEMDFTLRTLRASYLVHETPEVMVIHHGFRTWDQAIDLIDGYLYGIGAMFAKHFKCGHQETFNLLLHLAWKWAFGGPVVNLGLHPPRVLRLIAFAKGFISGLKTPVDRRKGQFIQLNRNT